jgi:hypothetical protein
MKSASVNKAKWFETREISYKEYCDQIIFAKKIELVFRGNEVYLKSKVDERLLLDISKPKAMWYEIWLQLRLL